MLLNDRLSAKKLLCVSKHDIECNQLYFMINNECNQDTLQHPGGIACLSRPRQGDWQQSGSKSTGNWNFTVV